MAKISFSTSDTEGFGGDVNLSINNTRTKATISYMDGGEITLFGESLKGNPEFGLKAGNIDKLVFTNANGDDAIVVEGHYKAAEVAESPDVESIFYSLFDGKDIVTGSNTNDNLTMGGKGDDQIFGKGGEDRIEGGRGDDIMSGGGAGDEFQFHAADGAGHDIITDFDTSGANADSLYFDGVGIERVAKAGGGDDCKLILDNGATVLLEDVTKAEFQDYWSSLP